MLTCKICISLLGNKPMRMVELGPFCHETGGGALYGDHHRPTVGTALRKDLLHKQADPLMGPEQ